MKVSRVSRHCYDKPHRCPGANGGGGGYARVRRCTGSEYVTYQRDHWWFGQCPVCGVLALPPAVLRWVAPTQLRWRGQKVGTKDQRPDREMMIALVHRFQTEFPPETQPKETQS